MTALHKINPTRLATEAAVLPLRLAHSRPLIEADLPRPQVQELLSFSEELVTAVIVHLHNPAPKMLVAEKKPNGDPVMLLDKTVQELVCTMIQSRYGDHGILAEENLLNSVKNVNNSGFCWIIDPIDGTKVCEKGGSRYAFSCALYHNGLPVLSTIWSPALMEGGDVNSGIISTSCMAPGVWRGKDSQRKQIEVKISETFNGIASGVSPFSAPLTEELTKLIPGSSFETSGGSAVAIAGLMILGQINFYSTLGREPGGTWAWDIAAAGYLLEKAGLIHYIRDTSTAYGLHFQTATQWMGKFLERGWEDPKSVQLTMLMLAHNHPGTLIANVRDTHAKLYYSDEVASRPHILGLS